MQLIKKNSEKGRTVFFNGTHYVKCWDDPPRHWIYNHVKLLREKIPGYVVDYGGNWISYTVIPGIPANTFPHTPEFIERIYNFCLDNIKETAPYAHGDWVLSNILIDGNIIRMCDWDNFGIYPQEEITKKLHSDLTSAFGTSFLKLIK